MVSQRGEGLTKYALLFAYEEITQEMCVLRACVQFCQCSSEDKHLKIFERQIGD